MVYGGVVVTKLVLQRRQWKSLCFSYGGGGGQKYLKPLLILKNSPANMIKFNICIEKLSSDVHISSVKAFEVQRLYSFRKVNQHQFLKFEV